jgi:pyruvate/2-oxoglutarate dehydrogenase complex dihydrolipoamide dehydrogenase (E3) component
MIVIGSGAIGRAVAREAAGLGARVALVRLKRADGYLDVLSGQGVSFAVEEREEVAAALEGAYPFRPFVPEHTDELARLGIDLYEGQVKFLSGQEVEVNGEVRLCGRKLVIAAGAFPKVPPVEGLEEAGYITGETVYLLKELPRHMVILGGGAFACIWGQALARAGSRVTMVLEGAEILPQWDKELIPYVKRALTDEGIRIKNASRVLKVIKRANKKILQLQYDGMVEAIEADEIMIAAGMVPGMQEWGLVGIGVRLDEGWISANRHLQTTQPHIYATGIACGHEPFAPRIKKEAKVIALNALLGLKKSFDETAVPKVIPMEPEVFQLGMTEDEARAAVGKVRIWRMGFDERMRLVDDPKASGLVKLIADLDGKIIGAHAIGYRVHRRMQEVVKAKANKKSVYSLMKLIPPDPSGPTLDRAPLHLWSYPWLKKLLAIYVRWFG